jgi:hypothetical protein
MWNDELARRIDEIAVPDGRHDAQNGPGDSQAFITSRADASNRKRLAKTLADALLDRAKAMEQRR